MNSTYLLIHVLADFRRFCLPDFDPADVQCVHHSLDFWYIRSRGGGEREDPKEWMMSGDVSEYGSIGI